MRIALGFFACVMLLLLVFCFKGLFINQHVLTSKFINKAVPEIYGQNLSGQQINLKNIKGPYLLNVFASWCSSCKYEHNYWLELSGKYKLIGIAYKNSKADLKAWLDLYGNPYENIILDYHGKQSMQIGVYGTPETFLVGKDGKIKYRHVGSMSEDVWRNKFLPLIQG